MSKSKSNKCQRMTLQRRIIQEILHNTTSHPTAENIYLEARKKLSYISLGTVYRNLKVLLQDNKIQELNYGKGVSHFDGNYFPHYHFVCQACGRVYDIDITMQQGLLESAKAAAMGEITSHRLEFYGICNACLMEKQAQAN